MSVRSLRIEKHVLGGLINNPKIFPDIELSLGETAFTHDIHRAIFSQIRQTLQHSELLDKGILAEKMINLGIQFIDDIPIYQYLESVSFTQIKTEAIIESAKELVKLKWRRNKIEKCGEISSFLEKNGNLDVDEIISTSDAMYHDGEEYEMDDAPVNLFENFEDSIEERGNNPQPVGFETPYKEFNNLYGGLRPGEIYAIASRPGQGKTTFINDMCLKTSLINNVPILVLDTEMKTEDIQLRFASSMSGVEMHQIESGLFRRNEEDLQKVREAIKKTKDNKPLYYHMHVANKNIDQLCSLVRRWYFSEVGRGNPCIIAYDYIKLTGEKVSANWAEYQAIGEKIDRLKRLAEELNAPLITAIQLNRSGESSNGVIDSSAIALSDRLQWFASGVFLFIRKSLNEIAEDGEQFGTHKLKPVKTRFLGADASGHLNMVRREITGPTRQVSRETWENNYLNFNVDKFDVQERGSLRSIVAAQDERFDLEDRNEADGGTL